MLVVQIDVGCSFIYSWKQNNLNFAPLRKTFFSKMMLLIWPFHNFQYLLENERIEEALELAENAISQNSADPGLESCLAQARVRSAFISLKRFDLHRTRELLILGRADPREVICLFPRLLPASSNFTRSVRALNNIADINQIVKQDTTKLLALETFLIEYLEYIRTSEGGSFVHKQVKFLYTFLPSGYCPIFCLLPSQRTVN